MGWRGLTDERWEELAPLVRSASRRGPPGRNNRRFLEAVAWVLRTGAPWRDLPPSFGNWSTVYQRFRRWSLTGRWEAIHRAMVRGTTAADLLLIDSTIVKAHPHAAGARRASGGPAFQALGRSRGGLTTKIHAVANERGRLLRFVLTGGEVNDVTQSEVLTEGLFGRAVVGDKAYDSDFLLARIEGRGMAAVIPSRRHRKVERTIDRESYATRNVIERLFGRLNILRRISTRYEKTADSFAGFLVLASALVVLSGWPA